MPEYLINGIPVNFPFEPYQVQRDYMARVIECLQNSSNGVLESPTGTGKTLSLLCSSLAWILHKKAQVQASQRTNVSELKEFEFEKKKMGGGGGGPKPEMDKLLDELNENSGKEGGRWGVPKIIYASRTHSQLTQAMQEMKNTSYGFMRAVILGSRDQLCIHPEVAKEEGNAVKTNLCKAKIQARACSFYSRVEACKERPEITGSTIMDIEDLVRVSTKLKACPFFMSKELIENADVLFMPYNYLLDPKARKANNLELANTIIILDEAHNVDKMCEESASMQIRSSDIALCIDDVTSIMKVMDNTVAIPEDDDAKKDFTIDDLALLKEMLLSLEKTVDEIPVMFSQGGSTQPGTYIFEIFEKANIKEGNYHIIAQLLENIIQYIATITEKNNFVRRGGGLQILAESLSIMFAGSGPQYRESIDKCYKCHIDIEEQKKVRGNTKQADGWTATKQLVPSVKANAKVINFWCFNPGFGMRQLLGRNARSIILTSGTLAPLKPLISELDIPIAVKLENPHIIDGSQVCVKIVGQGPDKESLNSSYGNRDNPKYISSLGRTILSFCPIIPGGLLVFFPSYPLLNKCQEAWQETGIWAQISRTKPIFVEPRGKDQFLNTMTEYYAKINDPDGKGAVFMAVCRGKVSEGLDFADMNGRACIITGLPFPPLKDARVILKKRYLQEVRTRENEIISGDEWYSLEAARAVNQAIGRVIRHKNDYGAILLCDNRFHNPRQKAQLSSWIQKHLNTAQHPTFGPIVRELSQFFRNAEKTLPQAKLTRSLAPLGPEPPIALVPDSTSLLVSGETKKKLDDIKNNFIKIENSNAVTAFKLSDYQHAHRSDATAASGKDFLSRLNTQVRTIDFNDMSSAGPSSQAGLVAIHKRERSNESTMVTQQKKRKVVLIPQETISLDDSLEVLEVKPERQAPEDRVELLKVIKSSIVPAQYKRFLVVLTGYRNDRDFGTMMGGMVEIFNRPELYYLLKGEI
ncbi:fanconi anemia group J protein [Culex quinquefasciatus]|uniref:Regulator of telomere elongation helicase 1 homolog n=1 Tax=Culex quinquefasciatus TaxID=7176 RepID=RTEL1_CULQU|nr:RecName: Full=Regulator of telomere elongation helicase 1 homolog [Culex quinquefasciatus]EDS40179.1 fanconi anemia group J protein [Culex quinquefasciatus]|eukprot:XP_001845338.1 fanconi anemia group J protein [Culex quinquefasciatus]